MALSYNPLDLVELTPLMQRGNGNAEVHVALVDGPVALDHPRLNRGNIQEVPGRSAGACTRADSMACEHGTLVAGILSAKRGSAAPAICPGCTLLLRPVFPELPARGSVPTATPSEVAAAFLECIDAGAHLINFSAALAEPRVGEEKELTEALDYAASHGAIVIVAAGNQGRVGSSAITRHPWVVPVVACDLRGRPLPESNLSGSVGKHGVRAPGESITSLGTSGELKTFGGTSAATAFVTGAMALLWSEFRSATAANVKLAAAMSQMALRRTVVPPLLNAWEAYENLLAIFGRRHNHEAAERP